jgi:hypothetical protein
MKHKLFKLFAFLTLSLVASSQVFSQNSAKSLSSVSGVISNDTIWNTDTVTVTGNITIPDTVSLTIEPGTVVLFSDTFCIDIKGQLFANGGIEDSIVFKAADTTGYHDTTFTGWNGLRFNETVATNSSSISYCIFEYVKADTSMYAAVFVNDFSSLEIAHSRFSYNYSAQAGSCIQLNNETSLSIHDNVFSANRSSTGCIHFGISENGDTVNAIIEKNTFRDNTGGDGPAIIISCYCAATILNNSFINNFCLENGGAVTITDHTTPILIGNLFTGNESMGNGGAIVVKSNSKPKIINNTIVNNHSLYGAGIWMSCSALNVVLQNNILWGNKASESGNQLYLRSTGSTYSIINNLLEGGVDSILFETPYSGILQDNYMFSPEFADYATGDLHLTCSSLAINAGSVPVVNMPLYDMDSNLRLNGSEYDLGAFEADAAATIVSQPQNMIVMNGDIATFTVVANGANVYQWEVSTDMASNWAAIVDDTIYSGATTSLLTVNSYAPMNGSLYRCIISGNCPQVTTISLPALLLVSNPDGFDENPIAVSVYPIPAYDFVNIIHAAGSRVIISDINGRIVADYAALSSDNEQISVSNLNNGVYFMKITSSNSTQIIRMIKD